MKSAVLHHNHLEEIKCKVEEHNNGAAVLGEADLRKHPPFATSLNTFFPLFLMILLTNLAKMFILAFVLLAGREACLLSCTGGQEAQCMLSCAVTPAATAFPSFLTSPPDSWISSWLCCTMGRAAVWNPSYTHDEQPCLCLIVECWAF